MREKREKAEGERPEEIASCMKSSCPAAGLSKAFFALWSGQGLTVNAGEPSAMRLSLR